MIKNEGNLDEKKIVFELIQKFLKDHPVIIWGSGATIPFGMPSMDDLNKIIKNEFPNFDSKNTNLEKELGKVKYKKQLPEIRKIIHDVIEEKDNLVLEKIMDNSFKHNEIIELINKIRDSVPKVVNIISTNYDKTLEYIMSYNEIPFTNGFTGKTLSIYNENSFGNKDIVNVIKVNGSIDWYDVNGEIRTINCNCKYEPEIIIPGKNKYE